jgi:hypothetical protein
MLSGTPCVIVIQNGGRLDCDRMTRVSVNITGLSSGSVTVKIAGAYEMIAGRYVN